MWKEAGGEANRAPRSALLLSAGVKRKEILNTAAVESAKAAPRRQCHAVRGRRSLTSSGEHSGSWSEPIATGPSSSRGTLKFQIDVSFIRPAASQYSDSVPS